MSSFTAPLEVRKIIIKKYDKHFGLIPFEKKIQKWRTLREFTYFLGNELSYESITVPEGFVTDFASVPKGLWNIFPPDGIYSQAAVLHDYLYQKKIYSRKKSDQIFLEAMEVLGVSLWKRRIMYRALRMFGWYAWKFGI